MIHKARYYNDTFVDTYTLPEPTQAADITNALKEINKENVLYIDDLAAEELKKVTALFESADIKKKAAAEYESLRTEVKKILVSKNKSQIVDKHGVNIFGDRINAKYDLTFCF